MQDVLRAHGIYKNGYGTVAKLVVFDKKISIGAKGLYCYFCSYAGAGEIAFPFRKRICEELDVSEKTYQTYLKELTSNNYITVEQKKRNNKFSHNVYTIIGLIEKERIKKITSETQLLKSVAEQIDFFEECESIDIAGYGKIPKTLTTDKNISIKAKAIYGFISVYCEKGYKQTPTKHALDILGISEDTYYKEIKELEKHGYLKKKEIKTKKGYVKKVLVINTEAK